MIRKPRRNFNRELLQGLWKIRNTDPRVRPWIRQCVEVERLRLRRTT